MFSHLSRSDSVLQNKPDGIPQPRSSPQTPAVSEIGSKLPELGQEVNIKDLISSYQNKLEEVRYWSVHILVFLYDIGWHTVPIYLLIWSHFKHHQIKMVSTFAILILSRFLYHDELMNFQMFIYFWTALAHKEAVSLNSEAKSGLWWWQPLNFFFSQQKTVVEDELHSGTGWSCCCYGISWLCVNENMWWQMA